MRKNVVVQLLSSLFMLYLAANSSAVNLDAPIGKNITVRSEFESARHAPYGVGGLSSISEMHKAVSAIISENKQKNTDTEAFLLGLYFRAWCFMDARLKVMQSQDFLNEYYLIVDIEDLKSGKEIAMMYYKEFRKRQTDMNIDNEILCSVAGIKKYNDFKQRLEQWDEIMKQPAEASIYEKLIKDLLTYKKGNNLGIVFHTVGGYFDHKAFHEKGARKYVEERMEFESSFEFYQKTGKSPLIFQVTLLNMSDKVIEVNPINFKITTKEGYTIQLSNFTHETINNFPIANLEPNTKTEGMLIFGINRDDKPIEIIYDDKIGNRVSREYKDAVLLERLLREGKKD